MDERTKELIAIGASFTAHCQPCLTFHVDKARSPRIGEDEINAAIAMGRMIQKGVMSTMNKFAEGVLVGSETSACCDSNAGNCCR